MNFEEINIWPNLYLQWRNVLLQYVTVVLCDGLCVSVCVCVEQITCVSFLLAKCSLFFLLLFMLI